LDADLETERPFYARISQGGKDQPQGLDHARIELETGRNAAPNGCHRRCQSTASPLRGDVSRLERAHPRWRKSGSVTVTWDRTDDGVPLASDFCPDRCTVGEMGLATVVCHPEAPISSLVPSLSCSRCPIGKTTPRLVGLSIAPLREHDARYGKTDFAARTKPVINKKEFHAASVRSNSSDVVLSTLKRQ
jgi:hypothetical protein